MAMPLKLRLKRDKRVSCQSAHSLLTASALYACYVSYAPKGSCTELKKKSDLTKGFVPCHHCELAFF